MIVSVLEFFAVLSMVADAAFESQRPADPSLAVMENAQNWVLMVRQTKGFWFTEAIAHSGKYNTGNPTGPNYCNLATLANYRKGGVFTFKMVWPGSNLQNQVWRQTSNPFTKRSKGVTGYVSVNTPYKEFWGGLEWNGKEAILDGSAGHPYYFYEVGAFMPFQGGIAGPLKIVDKVELYVEGMGGSGPGPMTKPTTRGSGPARPAPVSTSMSSWPCRVMGQGICKSAPRCIYSTSPAMCQCKDYKADFLFAIDASTQVGAQGFAYQKNLVNTMIMNLPFQSRAGVLTSDTKGAQTHVPKMAVNLQSNLASVRMAVETIEYAQGYLDISREIELALKVFKAQSMGRKMLRLVLFVAGKNGGTIDPCRLVQKLRIQRVHVIIIGVGNSFSARKVQCLVGTETNPNNFIVKTRSFNTKSFLGVWAKIDHLLCPQVVNE